MHYPGLMTYSTGWLMLIVLLELTSILANIKLKSAQGMSIEWFLYPGMVSLSFFLLPFSLTSDPSIF